MPAASQRLDGETAAYLAEMGSQLAQLTDPDEAALLAATSLAEVSAVGLQCTQCPHGKMAHKLPLPNRRSRHLLPCAPTPCASVSTQTLLHTRRHQCSSHRFP